MEPAGLDISMFENVAVVLVSWMDSPDGVFQITSEAPVDDIAKNAMFVEASSVRANVDLATPGPAGGFELVSRRELDVRLDTVTE